MGNLPGGALLRSSPCNRTHGEGGIPQPGERVLR